MYVVYVVLMMTCIFVCVFVYMYTHRLADVY